MNPHLISVRLNERQHPHKEVVDNKKMAYLIDAKTVSISELAHACAHVARWFQVGSVGCFSVSMKNENFKFNKNVF